MVIVPMITKRLGVVSRSSRSILPTGSLKIEDGRVLQEATVITHTPDLTGHVGVKEEWFEVPAELIAAIKAM